MYLKKLAKSQSYELIQVIILSVSRWFIENFACDLRFSKEYQALFIWIYFVRELNEWETLFRDLYTSLGQAPKAEQKWSKYVWISCPYPPMLLFQKLYTMKYYVYNIFLLYFFRFFVTQVCTGNKTVFGRSEGCSLCWWWVWLHWQWLIYYDQIFYFFRKIDFLKQFLKAAEVIKSIDPSVYAWTIWEARKILGRFRILL